MSKQRKHPSLPQISEERLVQMSVNATSLPQERVKRERKGDIWKRFVTPSFLAPIMTFSVVATIFIWQADNVIPVDKEPEEIESLEEILYEIEVMDLEILETF